MSQTVSQSAIDIIAEMLKDSKTIEQPPVLFLGSRSGLFYGHTGFYKDVKSHSSKVKEFDTLSDPMKFQECFKTLEQIRFSEQDIYQLLKKCISTDKNKIPVRTEDLYVANLILNDYFELIISTTIDPLLEEALSRQRILNLDPQIQQSTNTYNVLIQGHNNQEQILDKRGAKRKKVIKIFGDIESREYYTVQNELEIDLKKNAKLKTFLQDTLSETVLIIGFDSYWDRSLVNVFLTSGKDIYFISEDSPSENNQMMAVLERRSNGRRFIEEAYSYRNVVKELHEKVFLGGLPSVPLAHIKARLPREGKLFSGASEFAKTVTTRAIKIFYCYSRKDKALRAELEKHLEPLRRSGQITSWHDREIQPGMDWKREIDKHLNSSEIVLLLISPNFLSSDYCYGVEMQRALERHKVGEARVIPIILRPADWKNTAIGELQVLPTDGKAIVTWRNRDIAFQDVVRGIRTVVEERIAQS